MSPHQESIYWALTTDDSSAVIDKLPSGSPDLHLLTEGVTLAGLFPVGSVLRFSKDFPSQRKLFDFVANPFGTLIVSEKVKGVLESKRADNCEFLPVVIHDHKDKPAGGPYFILNVLGGVDAIDMERSTYTLNALDKTQILDLERLVLKSEGIPPNSLIFRPSRMMNQHLISQELHEAFQQAGVSGIKTYLADGWDGMDF